MCLFCKIIKKEIPADFVYEDEDLIVIKDINPKAPIHLLLIPKKHIESIITLEQKDLPIIGKLIWRAKMIAEKQDFSQKGYKLIFNCGQGGGQVIPHLHLHLLSGMDLKKRRL